MRQKNRLFGSAEWPVRSRGRSEAGREEIMFMHFGVEMQEGRSVSSRVTPWNDREISPGQHVAEKRYLPPGSRAQDEGPFRALLDPAQSSFPTDRGIGR